MKLNRLLEITTILLNRKNVTAGELAERFDVSLRTIYRDIDALSSSGVPVYTQRGANGGISVMEDYTVRSQTLSEREKDSIFLALSTLKTTKYPEIDAVLEKLGSIFKSRASDWVSVDFSPWGSNPNAYNKFTDIKNAIVRSELLEIEYINAQNERTRRKIEPFQLGFKHQAWYLRAWCRDRGDWRTFRISRIKSVTPTGESFDKNAPHKPPESAPSRGAMFVRLVLRFTRDALYRLYDDYDDDAIHPNGDGTYTLEFDFPEDEWVYGYILSFGESVKVVSPLRIREIIRKKCENILAQYK